MDERVDGARAEDAVRQPREERRHEHGLIRVERCVREAHLRMEFRELEDGDVRDLAARAAGRRHEDERVLLHGGEFLLEEVGDGRDALEREELRDIEDRAAADGEDAAVFPAREGGDDALDHEVSRLAATIGAVVDDRRARELPGEGALLRAAAREDEVALARRELREEFIYCMQQADLRRNLEGFHRLPLSRGQTLAHVLMARSKMLRPASSCSSVMTSGARKRMTLP